MARFRKPRFTALSGALLLTAVVVAACGGSSRSGRVAGPAVVTTIPPPAPVATSAEVTTTTTVAPTTTTSATPPTTAAPATTAGTAAPTTAPAPVAAAAACPSNLAATLRDTGSARQLITVESQGYGTTVATLETWERNGGCWTPVTGPWSAMIGENGFSDHHIEGDGTSPAGAFGIGPVMYGNAPNPGVQEPYHQLVCGDWWDEDPRSPAYNTFQHVACGSTPPFGGGSEALWTETQPYPSFAVIDFNTAPAVPYDGSGIFLHADTGGPTDGCVSVPLGELDQVLRWINPADAPLVVMAPAQEISRF